MIAINLKNLSFFVCLFLICLRPTYANSKQEIYITYLVQKQKITAALSNLDPIISNKGLQGTLLGIKDNNTTGQFTGHKYILNAITIEIDGDIIGAYKALSSKKNTFLISNLLVTNLTKIAQLSAKTKTLIFDIATRSDELRLRGCHQNIFYLLPSRAMRADALAQFMLKKRWKEWFLVIGADANDRLFATALKRAAKRFGIKIVAEKTWTHTYDARRTAQHDVPVFTQGVAYDVLVVADEQGLFGEYIDYRTWLPRPVIGTQGLVATSWHRAHEQWGAVQLQNRFKNFAGRAMTESDYGAYLAVRSIGEAVTRTQSNKPNKIKEFLISEKFALQGYKGKPLSFRSWNHQLRQPILLAAARSMITVAPQAGFLHPINELDTLGYDKKEIQCK